VLLETTAGQGNCIGHQFEQLAAILERVDRPRRYGICLDTCHVFAAGYDIRSPKAYERTMTAFDDAVGLGRLMAIHLNDSLRSLGSRVDRHAHIGRGCIGRRGLANVVNDTRLAEIPMLLETHKGTDSKGRDLDSINADKILSLVR
jgi:deoxyribonuclease-4